MFDEDVTRLSGILYIKYDTVRFSYPVQHIATNSSSTMPLTKVSFFPALNMSKKTKRIESMLCVQKYRELRHGGPIVK